MKILAFTDPHGSRSAIRRAKEKAKKADIVVCCGDLTNFGNMLDSILKDLDSWGKPILLIPGNHEEHLELKRECARFKHIQEIDRDFYELDGLLFAGYGGGGFSHETPAFKIFGRKIKSRLQKHTGKFILMLHQPPFGTAADLMDFGHVGNETFTEFIAETQPDLVLCGHLHECFRQEDEIGKSSILNPGPDGMLIEL